ncbi:unannotated protein [freshwater metagenome]|uniref:Unannotated protein n=1 Tax=freshwater metagenome TaxID=449393 RepID=A0A6J7XP98_9ZZZZ|nr:ribosome maturation factor RimP [Actinomycetota bacterium]
MSLSDALFELIGQSVTRAGYYLEEVQVASPGNHKIITCIVDADVPLNMDQVTSISREISNLLDTSPFIGETPFTLEVTSPGVDRPLTKPRHWKKNHDRLIKISKLDGSQVTGRIVSNTEEAVTLAEQDKTLDVLFADIKRAVVEIEFNRKGDL